MKPMIHPTSNECDFQEDAVRYFTGELHHADFEKHWPACATCREVAAVLRRLGTLAEAEPSASLTASILAAVDREKNPHQQPQWWPWAAAAVLFIGLSYWGVSQWKIDPLENPVAKLPTTEAAPHAEQGLGEALDWFCRNQEADGSWSPLRWGGDARFEVALTALPMLAILSANDEMTPQRAEAAEKAKRYLLSRCDEQGCFGPQFYGASHSQGIATLALLTHYKNRPDDETRRALHHALASIVSQQHEAGYWGAGAAAQADTIITLWQVEALRMAVSLGWRDMQPHALLGSRWLAAHFPQTPTADDRIDYFNVYYASRRLRMAGDATSREQLATIRDALLRKQVLEGTDCGSWTPDDRWAVAGGRLYSTAMASLCLR
jgi:hypothetical protein